MSDLEFQFEILTDLKRSIKSFADLKQQTAAAKKDFQDAQAKANEFGAAVAATDQKANSLAVQIALTKRELQTLAAQGFGKNHVEVKALRGEVATLEAELRRSLSTLRAQEKESKASADTAGRLKSAFDGQTAALALAGQALRKQGVDVGHLSGEYIRLQREAKQAGDAQARAAAEAASGMNTARLGTNASRAQAALNQLGQLAAEGIDVGRIASEYARLSGAMAAATRAREAWQRFTATAAQRSQTSTQYAALASATPEAQAAARAASAREVLGTRSTADIQAEIARIKSSYRDLAASGQASLRELAQAKVRMGERLRELDAQTNDWAKSLDRVKLQLLGLAATAAGALRFAGRGGGDLAEFNKQIALISTLGDRTPEQLAPLGKEIRALAQDLGVSAKGAAEANYQIVSSDVALEKSTGVLRQAIQAGIAGVTDTKTAAEVGLGVMHAYGYEIERLPRIYDVLFATQNKGVVTFEELAKQLGDVLSPARAAGVDLATVGGAIATLTLNSVRAPQAVTALKSAILQLAAPTAESKKALDQYGIRWNGLVGTLEQIQAKNLSLDAVMKIVGDRDAANGVLVLTQDLERLKRLIGEIGNSGGAFEAAFGKMRNTDSARIDRFNAALEDFRMTVGGAVLSLTPLLEGLTRLLRAYNDLPPGLQAAIALFLAANAGWLVFGRTVGALADALKLLWANLGGGAARAAAAEGAIVGAAGAASKLKLGLMALPAAFGVVGIAITALELLMDRWGKKAEAFPRKIEAAIRQSQENLKALSAGPLDQDLAHLRELYDQTQQRLAELLKSQAQPGVSGVGAGYAGQLAQQIRETRAQAQALLNQMAAVAQQKAALSGPLPAPEPTGTGSEPPGPPERGKATPYDAQFAATESQYRLPPGLLKAVADVETGGKFNPNAVSLAGAKGLMQFMPATAARFGVKDPFNADAAIEAAGQYFRKLLDLFQGDLVKAIAAYNAGEGNVQRLGLDTVLSERFGAPGRKGETMRYVPKVLGKLEDYGNVVGYQDQAERDIKAAEERRQLAEETTQFEQQQREAQLDAARRADEMETARLEATYRDRRIGASDYYAGLIRMQAEAVRRNVTELATQIQAEEALQRDRTQGTEDYLKGREKIFALERQIAAVRDGATAKALDQGRALAETTREQTQALSDQLNQLRLRLLEARRQGGPGLADTLIPAEQQQEFLARLQVLQDQYREFIAQLQQAGNAEGLALVNRAIRTEAVQGMQTETDRLSEFAVQGARNMQSAFADYLFDPFGQGLKGMARGFLDTLRRMAAEAASQMLLERLLGKNFAGNGQGGRSGELGGWIGAAVAWARGPRPATPYPNVPAESSIQVGPVQPSPSPVTTGEGRGEGSKNAETLGTLVDDFGARFQGLFNDGFFSGLGTLFRDGFSGIFGGLASMFGNLLNLMIGRGSSYQSDGMKALGAAISVVGAVASAYGGGGAAAGGTNAAANAGSGNGLGAVNVSGAGSSWGSSFSSGVYHRGGLVGSGGERRALPAMAFAGAPRYHGGGVAGLAPNEVPAVLMGGPKGKREEVLTADDPRHRDNLDRARRSSAASGQPAPGGTTIVNVLDPALVGQYLSTKAGERLIMNTLTRNSGAVKRLVDRG